MPLISVVIPFYNVSDYLQTCLESVQNQSYKNLEIILVNDGSTDGSAQHAQNFVGRDSRFRLYHQENMGLSAARNTGLKKAKGDYIFYLDSDDYLMPTALEVLLKYAKDYDAEVAQCNFYYDYPEYLLLGEWFEQKYKIYNREQSMLALIEQKELKNFAWGKLIQSKIAKRHLFPEKKFFEDTFWMMQVASEINRLVIIKEPLMYYLQRKKSISGSFSLRNLDQLDLMDARLEFLKKENELYDKALNKFIEILSQHNILIRVLPDNERKVYLEKIIKLMSKYDIPLSKIKANKFSKFWKLMISRCSSLFKKEVKWIKIWKDE